MPKNVSNWLDLGGQEMDMTQNRSLLQHKGNLLQSKLSGIPNLSDPDIENNYVHRINSDYYNLEEFKSSTRQIKKKTFQFVSSKHWKFSIPF